MRKMRMLALAIFMLLATPTQLLAEGFAVYEWGARGVALGGATVARTPDPSVVATNPAAITHLDGSQVQLGISLVMPYGKMSFNDGKTHKLKDRVWPMPAMYYTQQINDKLSFGIGEFSRFGLGFDYGRDWDGAQNISRVKLLTASLNPNFAYKVTDKLSVAIGGEIMWLDILLRKNAYDNGPFKSRSDVTGDNIGFGGNIALHYQFNDQWSAGIGYRSPVKHKVEGEAKFTNSNPMLTNFGFVTQDVEATVTLPESVTMGLAFSPIPKLSIEASAVWTRWSRFTDLDLEFDVLNKVENKKYWHNTWRLGLGVEYALTDWIDLRAGYIWDECPVNEKYEDYLIPTDNRHIWSVGVGFKPGNWTIDTAYAYVDPRERHYNARPADGVKAGKTKDSGSHVASISVGYKF